MKYGKSCSFVLRFWVRRVLLSARVDQRQADAPGENRPGEVWLAHFGVYVHLFDCVADYGRDH
jgi:hypothetical protein